LSRIIHIQKNGSVVLPSLSRVVYWRPINMNSSRLNKFNKGESVMLAIKGIYANGKIELQDKIKTKKPVPVIVTFLDDVERPENEKIVLDDFSFNKAKDTLKEYHGSISDAVIAERRSES
jgi:hypothetical protein